MKRIIAINILVVLTFATMLCGCSGRNATDGQPAKTNDPTALIVGKWVNKEADVVTEFKDDGNYKTYQGGELILSDTYKAEKVDDTTITLSTGSGSNMTIVFVDDNTFKSDDVTMTRASADQNSPEDTAAADSEAALTRLLAGKWKTEDGGLMIFEENGKASYRADADSDSVAMTYKIIPIDDTSMTITLIDVDGTTSEDTANFTDDNTMVIGGSTFTRVIESAEETEAASVAPEAEATANPPEPINTTVDKQYDFQLGKMTILFNDQCGARVDSNGVLLIGRGTILIKGEDPKGGNSSSENSLGYVMIAPKTTKQDLKKLRDKIVENYENTTADFQLGEYGSEVISGMDSLTATYSYVWEDAPHPYCRNVSAKTYVLNAPNNRGYIISLIFYDNATEDEYNLVYNIANSIKFYN